METARDRLRWARTQRRGIDSAEEFCRRYGLNSATYRTYETQRDLKSIDLAQIYARYLGVHPWWLLTGEEIITEDKQKPKQIPIDFYVGAGAHVEPFDDGPFDTISWSEFEGKHCAIVRGDSMAPDLLDRDIVVFDPDRPVPPETLLHLVAIVQVFDGPRTIKRIERGNHPHVFDLVPVNNETDVIRDALIDWAVRPERLIRDL